MDDFLPADRVRLFDVAEGHAELLGAAGDGRRARLGLPQGLVREARDPGGVQGEVRPRSRSAEDLGRAEGDRRVLPGPRDRRQEGLRRRDLHRARLGGHHDGRTAALYAWGFQYQNPDKPYDMEGFVNSPDAVAALEFYKELYKCCTPPGYSDAYMQEGLDAFKSGQVAMMMNWFAFWPGMYKDENVGGDKIGFFVNPMEKVAASHPRRPGHLGRRLLRQAGRRAEVHQVVRDAGGAEEVAVARRRSTRQGGAPRPGVSEVVALRGRLPGGDGPGAGLLAGAVLCRTAPVHAEAHPRLRRRRPGHGAGSA